MRTPRLTLRGPAGVLTTVHVDESELIFGSACDEGVFTVDGDGVAHRHARVVFGEYSILIEDLAGGTLVNDNVIDRMVTVDYPARLVTGEITIVIEKEIDCSLNGAETLGDNFKTELNPEPETISNIESTMAFGMEMQEDKIGERFQTGTCYARGSEIGRGGMARILSAKDEQLGRLVAVKVSTVESREGQEVFANEAEVLAKLAHPNIVPVYARGTDEHGRPFYSMKLVLGRTLQWIVNQQVAGDAETLKKYHPQRLLDIFRKVCDAIDFAHSKGYLHRDLKLENVMVGEFGEVLLMDWGLAKVICRQDFDSGTVAEPVKLPYTEGTPQYMSPEQADGIYRDLDERSDIYSLGGILYAMLTRRPPISGASVQHILDKVRSGDVSSFDATSTKDVSSKTKPSAVPSGLQAVIRKAMARAREDRYQDVKALLKDIEAYQGGFAPSAENASTLKRMILWLGRNKVLSGSTMVIFLVVAGFGASIVQKGREASAALQSLRETAPTFAMRAKDALEDGEFEEALKAATFAVKLQPTNLEYHVLNGDVLQLLSRWREAVQAYKTALQFGNHEGARQNLNLTEELIQHSKREGKAKAKAVLFESLNSQGRKSEALAFGKSLGDFWKDRKKDLSALPELVERLESKLIPVPGTKVLMSKTEFTVKEWKLYLQAEGLSEWRQPSKRMQQSDDHPAVMISWNMAKELCDWLSAKTGKNWRLPTSAEWEAAVGPSTYPWGEYYPPNSDDGNYAIKEDGKDDPEIIGTDGFYGTAPVQSFKANALGFYDLGGNAWEWMWDVSSDEKGLCALRGGGWISVGVNCTVAHISFAAPDVKNGQNGFRLALSSGGESLEVPPKP